MKTLNYFRYQTQVPCVFTIGHPPFLFLDLGLRLENVSRALVARPGSLGVIEGLTLQVWQFCASAKLVRIFGAPRVEGSWRSLYCKCESQLRQYPVAFFGWYFQARALVTRSPDQSVDRGRTLGALPRMVMLHKGAVSDF